MGVDYYKILQIYCTTKDDDLKKAYRKLAMKWHRDKNPNNKKDAEAKFKTISEAYDNSLWNNLDPNQVIGTAAILKEIDCLTVTVDDILKVEACVSSTITKEDTWLCGFGGWFDVHFKGRMENPGECEVELTTAPSIDDGTHWGQQVLSDPQKRAIYDQYGEEGLKGHVLVKSTTGATTSLP